MEKLGAAAERPQATDPSRCRNRNPAAILIPLATACPRPDHAVDQPRAIDPAD
jgi:hypothetical protein